MVQQYPFLSIAPLHGRSLFDKPLAILATSHLELHTNVRRSFRSTVVDQEMNAMFAACLVLTGLSFVTNDLDQATSWIL